MRLANREAGRSEEEIARMLQELKATRCIPGPEFVLPALQTVIDNFRNCYDSNLQQLLLTREAMQTLERQMKLIRQGSLSGAALSILLALR